MVTLQKNTPRQGAIDEVLALALAKMLAEDIHNDSASVMESIQIAFRVGMLHAKHELPPKIINGILENIGCVLSD